MKKSIFYTFSIFLFSWNTFAQSVNGQFSEMKNQEIRLEVFNGFETQQVGKATTDETGNFTLNYKVTTNQGMGYLIASENKPYILSLSDRNIRLKGESLSNVESIVVEEGIENIRFVKYATEQPQREQMLSAWRFLAKNYEDLPQFEEAKKAKKSIAEEIARIQSSEQAFLDNLPADSYMKWFLPVRKLVSNVSIVAQYYPEDIPATRQALRALDYTDERLYTSGLFQQSLENHVWFIENSSGELTLVFEDLNKSIDIILAQIKGNDVLYNEVSEYVFDLLEKRSLFTSAEYLSKKLLDSDDCGCVDEKLKKKLEKYGKMATGAIVPDIEFTSYTYKPEGMQASKLSEITADYYLVVFAAGWCPHCTKELPKLAEIYPSLKEKNVEVLLVSLDGDTKGFAQFAGGLPFASTTDLQKWESSFAEDYQVYATPSYFMMDKNRKLLIKPKDSEHVKAWVDYMIK